MLKRLAVDVRGDGAANAPVLQKVHGQIPVVRPDVRNGRPLRHQRRKQCKAGLQL